MTCTALIYHSSHYSLVIPISGSVTATDILTMTVTLTRLEAGSSPITFTIAGGGVTIVAGVIRIIILETDVTVAGIYDVKVSATNLTGKAVKITPCPKTITFDSQ